MPIINSDHTSAPDSEFDSYDNTYEEEIKKSLSGLGVTQDFAAQVKADQLIDIVQERWGKPADADVLDLGCGIGLYGSYLSGTFKFLSGIDVSSKCVDIAKQNNPEVNYLTYDGQTIPFEDTSLDVVYVITVMHHIPVAQWESITGDIKRVLRPGGLCVIFEHNPWNPATRWIVNRCEFDADAVLLSHRKARQLLDVNGFQDIASKHILTVPVDTGWARKLDKVFSRLPLGAQYYTVGTAP